MTGGEYRTEARSRFDIYHHKLFLPLLRPNKKSKHGWTGSYALRPASNPATLNAAGIAARATAVYLDRTLLFTKDVNSTTSIRLPATGLKSEKRERISLFVSSKVLACPRGMMDISSGCTVWTILLKPTLKATVQKNESDKVCYSRSGNRIQSIPNEIFSWIVMFMCWNLQQLDDMGILVVRSCFWRSLFCQNRRTGSSGPRALRDSAYVHWRNSVCSLAELKQNSAIILMADPGYGF